MVVQTQFTRHNPAAMQRRSPITAAFTLIELLVVIAIIAILIGLLFPAFKAVQDQAKKTQAKNDLTQIVNAVNAFYTEYGKYPVSSSITTDAYFGSGTPPLGSTSGGTNDVLFNELRACTAVGTSCSAAATLNTRQIVFISPPIVKTPAQPKSGIGTNAVGAPTPRGQFWDPWGAPYQIAIDSNYNNVVTAPAYSDLSYTTATNGDVGVMTGVIAWSYGSDGQIGTSGNGIYKNSDDVISWQ